MQQKRKRGRPRKVVNGQQSLIEQLRSGYFRHVSIATVTVKDVFGPDNKPLEIGLRRFSPSELIGEVSELFNRQGTNLEEQSRNAVDQIMYAAHDPSTGDRLFTSDEDREMLLTWPLATLADLISKIAQHSMLSTQAADEAKNESEQIQ